MSEIQLRIFRENSAEDYLQAAIEVGNWIETLAVQTNSGKIWKTNPGAADGFGDSGSLFGAKSLYAGSAGIGLFFTRLYEATGDSKWLAVADDAAEHILATEVGADWYAETINSAPTGVFKITGWSTGIFSGPLGEALFLENLFKVRKRLAYRDFVLRSADSVIAAAIEDENGLHWTREQDITGDGGIAVFLLFVYKRTGAKKYLDAALKATDYIARAGTEAPNGGKFWQLLDLDLLNFGFPQGSNFPGWSHGTAGIAWLFAAVYEATNEQKYLELAKAAVDYLKGISVGDETGRLIPYLDNRTEGPSYDKFYLGSCHGPVGSSLPFRLIYEATGDEAYRRFWFELSRGIVRAGAPEKRSWGFWNTQCLCCGTAGILEHFVKTYEATKQEEFLGYARRTGDILLATSDVRTPGIKRWYDGWSRKDPDQVAAYPGLYVGAAGGGSSLVSLYAALTGKSVTANILEYLFFKGV